MEVYLSVMDAGAVSEGAGAMQVVVNLDGELQTDVVVSVSTMDGTGMFRSHHSYTVSFILFQLKWAMIMSRYHVA